MRASLATVCISGSLEEKLTAIARAGFDGYELFENDFVTSELSAADVRVLGADLGISLELYQPFRDIEGTGPDVFGKALERAKRKFALMGELGVDLMLVCSNVATAVVDDDALAAEQLHAMAAAAHDHGIRLAYEPLAWGTFVSTYDHGWRIVEAADHPALGVCLDSFHILSRGSDLAGIARISAEKLFFCQLADAPAMDIDVLSWSRHHRLFPGEGDWDLPDFVVRVLDAGYAGPLSLEVFNDVFRQGDPTVTARDARRSLRVLEDEAAALSAAPGASGAVLPPVQAPRGFDFLEVLPGEGSAVAGLLDALGFRRGGRHRRKEVDLWEQGDVRVVVNQERPARRARIAGVGLAVDDPRAAVARLEALRIPRVPRDQEPDERSLALLLAPDGSEISIGSAGSPWRSEFPGGHQDARGGIRRIDHVALVQPWRRLHEAASLLRSALALHPEPDEDLVSPIGLVRSRALTSADRGVRLVLNVAPIGDEDDPQFANHVAFAVDDLVATVGTLVSRGLELLPIPDNYYDDLVARFGLAPERAERLRAAGILYDRNGQGEFLHAYTPVIGGFYVELVERIGGYDGYGAANASVRLAALRRAATRA